MRDRRRFSGGDKVNQVLATVEATKGKMAGTQSLAPHAAPPVLHRSAMLARSAWRWRPHINNRACAMFDADNIQSQMSNMESTEALSEKTAEMENQSNMFNQQVQPPTHNTQA